MQLGSTLVRNMFMGILYDVESNNLGKIRSICIDV